MMRRGEEDHQPLDRASAEQGTVHSEHTGSDANPAGDDRGDVIGAGHATAPVSASGTADGNTRDDLSTDRNSLAANGSQNRKAARGERDEDDAALIDGLDSERFRSRWHDVQAAFVDDPQRAVQDADELVAELIQRLVATFAERKQSLEGQWQQGGDAETEDLRLALRSYRSFFDRLLPRSVQEIGNPAQV
jgi:hypothetical protein